jgi:hypothetical protein
MQMSNKGFGFGVTFGSIMALIGAETTSSRYKTSSAQKNIPCKTEENNICKKLKQMKKEDRKFHKVQVIRSSGLKEFSDEALDNLTMKQAKAEVDNYYDYEPYNQSLDADLNIEGDLDDSEVFDDFHKNHRDYDYDRNHDYSIDYDPYDDICDYDSAW